MPIADDAFLSRRSLSQIKEILLESGLRVMIGNGEGIKKPKLVEARTFDQSSEGNDPHGEHDFGAFDYQGQKIFWKIDYYNTNYTMRFENPADPTVTHRVLCLLANTNGYILKTVLFIKGGFLCIGNDQKKVSAA